MTTDWAAGGGRLWRNPRAVKLRILFFVQKRYTRVLFGGKEAYVDKFRTSARPRPYDSVKHGL